MIIDDKSVFSALKETKDRFIKGVKEKASDNDDWDDLHNLLELSNKKKYLFSKSVIETLNTIKIKDDFDYTILKESKTKEGVIIIDNNELFVVYTTSKNIRVLHFNYDYKNDIANNLLFTIRFSEGKLIIDNDADPLISKKFLQCIIYLDFLPIETIIIKPGGKTGTKKSGKVINKLSDDFIYVTKAWNQEYKTLPGKKYLSRSHWGIRWTGIGRKIPKLVFVKASYKQRYIPANKEKIQK